MRDTTMGNRAAFSLPGAAILGAAIGATAALLMAPSSGARTRHRIAEKGEKVKEHLIHEGKEAAVKCDKFLQAQRGNGGLARYGKRLADEAATIFRAARNA
jgi:gas vesicle protein